MANLYDGSRVFTAAAGNTALASDQNDLQDKLILGLKARYWALDLALGVNDGVTGDWNLDTADLRWEEETHTSGGILRIPVILPADARITEINVWILGTASQTGGSIDLYVGDASAGTGGVEQVIDNSNPWAVTTITKVSATGLSIDLDIVKYYWLQFTNAKGGPIADNYVYQANVKAQWHNGS